MSLGVARPDDGGHARRRRAGEAFFRSAEIASALTHADETAPLLPPRAHLHRPPMQRLAAFRLEDWREHLLLLDACADLEQSVNRPQSRAGGDASAQRRLDFTTVGPYLLALQLVAGCAAAALVSVLVPYATAADARTSLRVLLASALAGAGLLLRPAVLGKPDAQRAPLHHLFKVLRWGAGFWIGALVAETLAHGDCACGLHEAHALHGLRRGLVGLAIAVLLVAAAARVFFPTSRSDASVFLGLGALALLALAPQALDASSAPLGRALGLFDACVRVLRAAAWALAYAATVLACAPERILGVEPLVLAARGLAASAWVLVCPPWLLAAAPCYVLLLAHRRVQTDASSDDAVDACYETLRRKEALSLSDPDEIRSQTSSTDEVAPAEPEPTPVTDRQRHLLRVLQTGSGGGDRATTRPTGTRRPR